MTQSVLHVDPFSLSDADFLAKAQSMCPTKAAYTTRAEANTTVKRAGLAATPYLCPWCNHYHLTSYDRARAKAFNRRLKRLLRVQAES